MMESWSIINEMQILLERLKDRIKLGEKGLVKLKMD